MSTDIEKQSLEAHVELCAERYGKLETKLEGLEKKVEKLEEHILAIKVYSRCWQSTEQTVDCYWHSNHQRVDHWYHHFNCASNKQMKIIELVNDLRVVITNEESDVLGKFHSREEVLRKDLNEREIQLANQLVNKDILYRQNQNGRITYRKKAG